MSSIRWPWLVVVACVGACATGRTAPVGPPTRIPDVAVVPAEPCPPEAPNGPSLPKVELQKQPMRATDAYTVWGLGYSLRSRQHRASVTRGPVFVTGFIVATNLASAPACAVHQGGVADPEDCTAPIPAFWLGDRPDAPLAECIKVMGFASNYAQIYDAIQAFDRGEQAFDTFWGGEIPNPLPAVGALVTVSGQYGTTFSLASSGSEVDDTMGIVTFGSMLVLEPARELATLPGVIRKPQP